MPHVNKTDHELPCTENMWSQPVQDAVDKNKHQAALNSNYSVQAGRQTSSKQQNTEHENI